MLDPVLRVTVIALLITGFLAPAALFSQTESIGSEHLLLRMPSDRSVMGRDLAAELERCYLFMNRSTANSLPRKVIISPSWERPDHLCDRQNSHIVIGMQNQPASISPRDFMLHAAAKELARLGLLELSAGARREDTEFLFEGMSEILVHEYEHSSKALEAAWTISKFLDDMKLLGMASQRSWTQFSFGKRCFRNAAPGITLLTTYRELLGRDAPIKLFEALKKNSLTASLSAAFRAPVAEIESTWLQRVREYASPEEITIAADEVPQLLQTALIPGNAKPGASVEVQLYFKSSKGVLLQEGLFFRDHRTGRVMQPQLSAEKSTPYTLFKLQVDSDCPPGSYKFQVTAIDESGNLRSWPGTYKVSD